MIMRAGIKPGSFYDTTKGGDKMPDGWTEEFRVYDGSDDGWMNEFGEVFYDFSDEEEECE